MTRLLNYGFVKGKISTFETQNIKINDSDLDGRKNFPHYNMTLNCNGRIYIANINIFSNNQQSPNLKVYFSENPEEDLLNKDVFNKIKHLDNGIYQDITLDLSLDYIRGKYFDLNNLQVIIDDRNIEKDILYYLIDKQMHLALENDYDICLWGQHYDNLLDDGSHKYGIHDIHLNQGNKDVTQNGIWSDGALIIIDTKTNKMVFSFFVAFSRQCLTTDNDGNCVNNNPCHK